jgi:hypothetical protein
MRQIPRLPSKPQPYLAPFADTASVIIAFSFPNSDWKRRWSETPFRTYLRCGAGGCVRGRTTTRAPPVDTPPEIQFRPQVRSQTEFGNEDVTRMLARCFLS